MTEHQIDCRALFDEQIPFSYDQGFKDGSRLIANYYGKFSREQFFKWFTCHGMVTLSSDFVDCCYSAYLCGWTVARGGRL